MQGTETNKEGAKTAHHNAYGTQTKCVANLIQLLILISMKHNYYSFN